MIRVHHLNASRSHRILWLLEELGLEYEIVAYQRDKKTMLAPESLRRVHPLGKSPVLEVDGRILAESCAIIEIMADRHGQGTLAPERGTPAWERYLYWLHYAEGSAMSPLLLKLVLTKMGPLGWPALGYVNGQLKLHSRYMESELEKHPYFGGETFTAADIAMSFPAEAFVARGPKDLSQPNLKAFLERIHARPAYQRATARGGKLEILG
jgi:glutathione S-transferase